MLISQTPILRPMTDDDRAILLARSPQPQPQLGWWQVLVIFVSFALTAILYPLLVISLNAMIRLPDNVMAVALFGTPVVPFATVIILSKVLKRAPKPKVAAEYAEDVADGQVAVYRYTAAKAVRLLVADEDVDDGCPSFFLQLDDGQLLYLTGEYLADPVMEGQFPCDRFEVIRLPRAEETLCLQCMGTPLDAAAVQFLRGIDWELTPQDNEVISEQMDALPDLLRAGSDADGDGLPDSAAQPVRLSALPATIHPSLRPLTRIATGYYIGIVFVLAFGLGPISFVGIPMLRNGLSSGFELFELIIPVAFLLVPILGIPFILKARLSMLAGLRLASKTMNEVMPVSAQVTLRYVLTVTNGSDSGGVDKHFYIELPADFARNNHLPREFEVLPPLGEFKKMQSKHDWAATGKSGTFTHDLYIGPAQVYAGADGMVVIDTGKGCLVRQLEVQVEK